MWKARINQVFFIATLLLGEFKLHASQEVDYDFENDVLYDDYDLPEDANDGNDGKLTVPHQWVLYNVTRIDKSDTSKDIEWNRAREISKDDRNLERFVVNLRLPEDPNNKGGPGNKPGGPGNKPGGPGNKPGGPGNKPGGPGNKPGGPGNKPGGPENKPGGPGNKPGGPGNKPGGSENKPGGPKNKPGGSGNKPGGPKNKPGGAKNKPDKEKETPGTGKSNPSKPPSPDKICPSRKKFCTLPKENPANHCAKNCRDIKKKLGSPPSGIYEVWPTLLNHAVMIFCDMESYNGSWTLFQRRHENEINEPVNFNTTWEKYRVGFGKLDESFWLGNDAIFALTNETPMRLRINTHDFDGGIKFADYDEFRISSKTDNFKLTVGKYTGDAGDALKNHNGKPFSTFDENHTYCNDKYKGGWWFGNSWLFCHNINLNGPYLGPGQIPYADGISWQHHSGYHRSLKKSEMKFTPVT